MATHKEFEIGERRPDPTPDEIREMCWAFQSTWSPKEEYARRHWSAEDRSTRCTQDTATTISRVEIMVLPAPVGIDGD